MYLSISAGKAPNKWISYDELAPIAHIFLPKDAKVLSGAGQYVKSRKEQILVIASYQLDHMMFILFMNHHDPCQDHPNQSNKVIFRLRGSHIL